jgi:hypothetical protein
MLDIHIDMGRHGIPQVILTNLSISHKSSMTSFNMPSGRCLCGVIKIHVLGGPVAVVCHSFASNVHEMSIIDLSLGILLLPKLPQNIWRFSLHELIRPQRPARNREYAQNLHDKQ